MKKYFFFLITFLLYIFSPHFVFASEYFDREYTVLYTVQENGTTSVQITVTLINKTSDYYASSDTIQVGFESITNVKASDPDGPLEPKITKTEAGNEIELIFKKKVVGKDKKLVFNLSFDTPNIAKHDGKIWEINIPGIANPEEFSNFTAEVRVPSTFGKPAYIKPFQKDNTLIFSKEQLGKSGISLAFGTEQIYQFNLTYHLRNTNVFPIRTEIALPPTTNYQEVVIDAINPHPENVTIDKDGNWLAEYILAPSQRIDVTARGRARIYLEPRPEPLSKDDFRLYTKEKPFWQSNNPKIKELAQKLKTPRAIYDYVVSTLDYDFSRVTQNKPRLGALKALEEPQSAVCLEFTDLFIALARAAGIPAREINGYAHTENPRQRPLSLVQDILHAWPEYYDFQRQTWVMVDPTWENTTGGIDYFDVFDYDHFTFVRKGIDSQYPIPPGGYKYSGDEKKKDISISFVDSFSNAIPKIQIVPIFPDKVLAGVAINGKIQVINMGGKLSEAQTASIISKTLTPSIQTIFIPQLPPFGKKEISFSFRKTPFFSHGTHTFTFTLKDTIIAHSIKVSPFTLNKNQIIGGVGVGISTIILFIIAIKARSLRFSR